MSQPAVIRFKFEGKVYELSGSAYPGKLIKLPDGTLIEVGMWLDVLTPPKPVHLKRCFPPEAKISY